MLTSTPPRPHHAGLRRALARDTGRRRDCARQINRTDTQVSDGRELIAHFCIQAAWRPIIVPFPDALPLSRKVLVVPETSCRRRASRSRLTKRFDTQASGGL